MVVLGVGHPIDLCQPVGRIVGIADYVRGVYLCRQMGNIFRLKQPGRVVGHRHELVTLSFTDVLALTTSTPPDAARPIKVLRREMKASNTCPSRTSVDAVHRTEPG